MHDAKTIICAYTTFLSIYMLSAHIVMLLRPMTIARSRLVTIIETLFCSGVSRCILTAQTHEYAGVATCVARRVPICNSVHVRVAYRQQHYLP